MVIIQQIWTSLTTPNEILANIITTPLIFVEAFVSMLLFTTILKISSNKRQKFLYVISVSFLGLVSRYLIPNPYGTIINLLSMVLIAKTIFSLSLLKSIIAFIFPLIITAIAEYIISNTYFKLINITLIDATTIPIHRLTLQPLIYLFEFITYLILKHRNYMIDILDNLSKKNKILLIFYFVFSIITIFSQILITTFYNNTLPFIFTFLSIIILISYVFLTILILKKVTTLELTKMDLEETKIYNKTLSILHDNIRGFKHDFNNILQAIGGYITTNDMDGLKKYYSQLEIDCQRANNLSTLNPDTVNNPAIYSILASKYHKADSLGIKVNLEIFLDLNKLNIKIYEFTRILGILLDNAIEATADCTEKIINVIIRKDFNSHRQLLIIENTYNNKNIDTEKIFEKGYSTKETNTGLGLWEVRQILYKNNNLNLFTSKNDKMFKQQLEIY
ncbi:MAG: GHKL domain-containing protein [Clostridia bacterium]|nr:GHKL domain-containing protein [Clostridia bacterium]